jgi:uncharacterized membrane protein YdbT with pleckstrin-like domain
MMWPMAGSDSLTEGEQLVLRLHPHAKTMVRPAVILAAVLAAAVVAIVILPSSASQLWPIRAGIGVLALIAALVWFGVPFLRWRTTTYEVTMRRLRLREGILSRTGRDFPLNRISDVSFSQSVLDRMFGCGRLIVESPGEHGQLVLSEIPDVKRVQGILFQLVGDEANRVGSAGGPPGDGT